MSDKISDQMFDNREDHRADRALHAGLRDLPTPEASADFDARILAALIPRPPIWQTAWIAVRPAASTALCGLIVMLLLVHLAQQAPGGAAFPFSFAARGSARTPRGTGAPGDATRGLSLEAIDKIDLSSASLSYLSHPIYRITRKGG